MADTIVDEVGSEFYLAYGRAMAAWSELERGLGTILVRVAKLSPTMAGALYYSARSFHGRAEMIQACIPFARTIPAGKDFLRGVVKRASGYSSARNALAHDRHMVSIYESDPEFKFKMSIVAPDGRDSLTLEGIRNAGNNFLYLNQILVICLGQTKLLREPELSLELLALMPIDPVAAAVDLTKANAIAKEIERSPH